MKYFVSMRIHYDTDDQEWTPKNEQNLLELCIRKKIPLSHSCEGMASCGTCRVIILDGTEELPPRNNLEQEMADDRGFRPEERLACQLNLSKSFSFKLPED